MGPWFKMHLAQLHLILDQVEKQVPDFSDIILTTGSPVRVEAGGELHKRGIDADYGPILYF